MDITIAADQVTLWVKPLSEVVFRNPECFTGDAYLIINVCDWGILEARHKRAIS